MASEAESDRVNPAPDSDTNYLLSEANSTAKSLLAISRNLKEGALRLAQCLAALAEDNEHKSVRITTRKISELTGLVPSALNRAINELTDPKLNYVTIRRGTASQPNAYILNFLRTIRGASFGEARTPGGVLSLEKHGASFGKARTLQAALPLEKHGASVGEAVASDSKELTDFAGASNFDVDSQRLIDRIYSAKPTKTDPDTLRCYRGRLHGYMKKLGRDHQNKPIPDPHPPDDLVVAQFVAIAPPAMLEWVLDTLFTERRTCSSYGWFVTVGIQRIHRISWEKNNKIKAHLQDVKRAKKQEAAVQASFAEDLLKAAVSGVKRLR